MSITPFDYHDDELNHGNYQYVTLKEVIDNFMVNKIDDDDILKNTRRSLILRRAKDGIRELNKNRLGRPYAMEITVPDKLYFALPHDFVNYLRVSLVVTDQATGSFRLVPLDVNDNINVSDGYLQDNNAEILFDENGYILKADSSNAYNLPYKKYEFAESYNHLSGNAGLNTSKLSKHGEVKIDREHGKIVFSSNLADREIVFEYRSDGLAFDTYNEDSIKVHKDAIQCLDDWIYYKCIERKQSISLGEKQRALRRYKTTRHEAKLEASDFNLLELTRTMNLKNRAI